MGSAQGLLADLTEPQRGLGWALLSLAYHCWYCPPPCPLPAGTGPSHVLVYQAGLEELRERAAQQDKHSNLLQNILGQMVSAPRQRGWEWAPTAPVLRGTQRPTPATALQAWGQNGTGGSGRVWCHCPQPRAVLLQQG